MLIRQPNIQAFEGAIADWRKVADKSRKNDLCLSVGYMSMGYDGPDPANWKPIDCGFNIIVKENMVTIASTRIETRFTQSHDGIEWTIRKYRNNKVTTLHNGTIRDISLLTCTPCPNSVRKSMLNVAQVAVELAKVEQKLMHI